jgi:hypothetical protein
MLSKTTLFIADTLSFHDSHASFQLQLKWQACTVASLHMSLPSLSLHPAPHGPTHVWLTRYCLTPAPVSSSWGLGSLSSTLGRLPYPVANTYSICKHTWCMVHGAHPGQNTGVHALSLVHAFFTSSLVRTAVLLLAAVP